MGLNVRVDGVMVAVAAAAVGVVIIYTKRKKIAEKLSPASNENLIYKDLLGGGSGGAFDNVVDHYFGYLDLINPFNGSDEYAKQVWGIN